MQKIGLMVVVSGTLIVIGLILLALGNQVILDEINQGNGIVSIRNYDSFKTKINELIQSNDKRDEMGEINYNYIKSNQGATKKVITYLNEKK